MDVTFDDIINRIDAFDVDSAAISAIEKSSEKMKYMQQDQLLHGQRANGRNIGTYKNERYAVKKYIQNPLAGFRNMDWILTGELKKQVFVLVSNSEIEINSLDPKTVFLIKRLGDPFGLTSTNEEKLINGVLSDNFYEIVNEKLQL